MRFERFCSSRVVIVAGKGGVGKTTVTAALAVSAARAGSRVLIIEVEGKSALPALFDLSELTYETILVAPEIEARTLTPDQALVEYLNDHGLRRISRRLARLGVLDVVSGAIPGIKDILVLGKIKQLEQSAEADLILVDAPAAGHAVTFLQSPRGLMDAVSAGPIRRQAEDVAQLLADPRRCQVVMVTLPEETPVNELVETAYALEDRVGVALAPVVVNGCLDQSTGALSVSMLETDAARAGLDLDGPTLDALVGAAELRTNRAAAHRAQAERLAEQLPVPQIRLPFLFSGDLVREDIDRLADAMDAGVAALGDAARGDAGADREAAP